MQTQNSPTLNRDAAQKILRYFLCVDRLPPAQQPDTSQVQQALLLMADHSDYQILGICADSVIQATTALATYLTALGYELTMPETAAVEGPIYLKYNPKTGRCHVDRYMGEHRGVLVSCQSAYDGDVNETFGHLPLDLFATSPEG